MRLTIAFALGIAASLLPAQAAPLSQQSTRMIAEPAVVPESLELMVKRADAIIRGTVTSAGTDTVPLSAGGAQVVRRSAVLVLDVIKGEAITVGETVSVLQEGGSALFDGREVSTPYADRFNRLLAVGEEVIVTLVAWPKASGYAVVFGSSGIYDIRESLVHGNGEPRSKAHALSRGNRRTAAEFVAQLKTFSKGKSK